jgi:colanic acid biosynthesis glycosyl transferase WcaI
MRILFITQWFQPEPFLKGLPFAKELVQLGHEVQVLTGFPNYPGGRLYAPYRIRLLQREEIEGVHVVRVPLYPSHDNSGSRRFFNYMSFAICAAVIGPWVVKRADVAYVYHPPATVQFSAAAIRLFRRIPLVYDIQDLWPDSLAASGMFTNRFGLWCVDRVCRIFYRLAKKIVVLSPGYKEELIKRGVPKDKLEVIYNWCDDSNAAPAKKDPALASQLGLAGHFNVMFAGNLGKGQALGSVLAAAEIVQAKYPDVRFVFVGDGVEAEGLKQKAQSLRLSNVLFLGRRPVSQIGGIMNLADVLLVHLKNNDLYAKTIPSKTQAYMAAGKPILMGVKGDAADLVLRAKAGLECEPDDPESIAGQIERLRAMPKEELEKMGENGKAFYMQELDRRIGAKRFEEIFRSVARSRDD